MSSEPKESERLRKLRALDAFLWESMKEATVGVRAQLAAQYRATLADIDSLTKNEHEVGDPIDEVAKRRIARRRAAEGSGRASRSAQ